MNKAVVVATSGNNDDDHEEVGRRGATTEKRGAGRSSFVDEVAGGGGGGGRVTTDDDDGGVEETTADELGGAWWQWRSNYDAKKMRTCAKRMWGVGRRTRHRVYKKSETVAGSTQSERGWENAGEKSPGVGENIETARAETLGRTGDPKKTWG